MSVARKAVWHTHDEPPQEGPYTYTTHCGLRVHGARWRLLPLQFSCSAEGLEDALRRWPSDVACDACVLLSLEDQE